MIYAGVAVDRKTSSSDLYSFALTPEQMLKITIGSLVEVEFGARVVRGIVVRLQRQRPAGISAIKTVRRVVSPKPVMIKNQLDLAAWLSDYYGCSAGEAVFTMIPRLSIKILARS